MCVHQWDPFKPTFQTACLQVVADLELDPGKEALLHPPPSAAAAAGTVGMAALGAEDVVLAGPTLGLPFQHLAVQMGPQLPVLLLDPQPPGGTAGTAVVPSPWPLLLVAAEANLPQVEARMGAGLLLLLFWLLFLCYCCQLVHSSVAAAADRSNCIRQQQDS